MSKKLISILLALVISSAFFMPVYAEETEDIYPDETIIEILTSDVATLQPVADETPETEEITVGNGVIETPLPTVPSGNGTVLEDVGDDEVSRQFITVQSRGGNIFYIIIENDRNTENVYFLNAVDDFDLLSFSENFPEGVLETYEELKEQAAVAEAERVIEANQSESEPTVKSDTSEPEEASANGTKNYVVIGIGVCFLGGLIYFKFFKGKGKSKVKSQPQDDEDDIYEDNYEEREENSEAEQEYE